MNVRHLASMTVVAAGLLLPCAPANAVPVVVTLVVHDASGTVQRPASSPAPYTHLDVTFSAATDTAAFFSEGAYGWAAFTPISISVPGLMAGIAEVPTSSVSGGPWDASTGYIAFELGSKVDGVAHLQGAYSWEPALLDLDFMRTFGPLALPAVRAGKSDGSGDPLMVTMTDGSLVTVNAISDGVLTVALPAAVAVPLDNSLVFVFTVLAIVLIASLSERGRLPSRSR